MEQPQRHRADRRRSAPREPTPPDPERVARLHAEIWWNALTAPPARRGHVRHPLYVRLLSWLLRDHPPSGHRRRG